METVAGGVVAVFSLGFPVYRLTLSIFRLISLFSSLCHVVHYRHVAALVGQGTMKNYWKKYPNVKLCVLIVITYARTIELF